MNHCILTKCRSTENLQKNFFNKKTGKQYYMCRKCQTERARKYRATPKGLSAVTRANIKSEKNHPGSRQAWGKLAYALKKGLIKRPEKCEIADCEGVRLDAHHFSYRNALFVRFFCRPHHKSFHLA